MDACYCDYDIPSFYRATEPVARKSHQCGECGRMIAPGEKYERVSAISDRQLWHNKTCARCLALRRYVVAHVPCCCWSHGNMIEEVMQSVDEYAHEAPGLWFGAGRLRAAIRRAPRFDQSPRSTNGAA